MQSALAHARERRWLRWGRVLLLGVVLGLLQFLVLLGAVTLQQAVFDFNEGFFGALLPWWPFVALAAFLYLLIPALGGFLAARQSEEASSGKGVGCLVGGIGFLVAIFAGFVGLSLVPPSPPPPPCPPYCPTLGQAAAAQLAGSLVGELIIFIIFWEGLAGAVGGLLGGWIGSNLGHRWATRPRPSSATAEETVP